MSENKWRRFENIPGPSLILGPGFDYEACLTWDKANKQFVITAPYPSRETDENYPYPNMMELVIEIKDVQQMFKEYCCTCKTALATWNYHPYTEDNKNTYYCDDHVHRGCSCNLKYDEATGEKLDEEYVDDLGRKLPCCEYMYFKEGFYIHEDED